jgi:hypothetical protein
LVKHEPFQHEVFVLSVFLFIGGLLLFSSPFAYPLSTVNAETTKTVDLSYLLSLENPSHNMSLDSTTREVEILRLQSNSTPVRVVAYGISGIFLELSNVTSIRNLVLDFHHDNPWDIGFIRESGDANVTMVARLHNTASNPSIIIGPHMVLFGTGAAILGVSLWCFHVLSRRQSPDTGGNGSRRGRPTVIVALMLLSSLCLTPITVIYGIYGGAFYMDANFAGYTGTMRIDLKASHPEEQVYVYLFGNFPAIVHITNLSGQSVRIESQTDSVSEQLIVNFTSQKGGLFNFELQNDTVLVLTRANGNTSLGLSWSSGTMIINHSPNWLLLLSPFVGLPAVVGIALLAYGLTAAKKIDSARREDVTEHIAC